jgi:hypothetical protein
LTYFIVFENKASPSAWRKNLRDCLLYAKESCSFVIVHSTSMNDHHAVDAQAHPIHHLAVVFKLSNRSHNNFGFGAAELGVLPRVRSESVPKLFGEFPDARKEGCTIIQRVAIDCMGCKGKHLRGHTHKLNMLIMEKVRWDETTTEE